VKALLNLVGKALLPAALVFCAIKVSNAVHEGTAAVHDGAAAATQVANTTKQIVDNAPQTAHNVAQETVKGVANGAVQVAATPVMVPARIAGEVVKVALPSKTDRDNVERIVNPGKWKIF